MSLSFAIGVVGTTGSCPRTGWRGAPRSPWELQHSMPFSQFIRLSQQPVVLPSYFFAPLLWAFITESSLPGDLGTCQKHQLSSNHQAEEREGDQDGGSLTHHQLTLAPSPGLAWPSPTLVSRLLLCSPQGSSALRHPHPAPCSWDSAQSGRKSSRQKEKAEIETREEGADDLSGDLGLGLFPATYQLCDLRQSA